MNKLIITLAAGLVTLSACSDHVDAGAVPTLQPVSNITIERLSANDVEVKWTDNSTSEIGYNVFVRRVDEPSTTVKEVASVEANVTSCVLKDVLQEGLKYYVGVQAVGKTEKARTISVVYDMLDYNLVPKAAFQSINSGTNCIWGVYTVTNVGAEAECGLCWSAEGVPSVTDSHIPSPEVGANGEVFQVIPNTQLEYGVEYQVRAYIKDAKATYYSPVGTAKMTEDYPAITLEWTKVDTKDIPAAIEVYTTTSKLNGRPFNAWYAIADVTNSDVEFRTYVPSQAQTIDEQAESFNGDCYVMINGGYFYDGRNTGLAVVNGKENGSVNPVRGSLLTSHAEYNEMYNITRGIFGVDNNNVPAVYWTGASNGTNFYYNTPLPSVVGENKYAAPNKTNPANAIKWNAKFALSAGPLLLIDGKIPFDFTMTDGGEGYYLTNYEVIPYDIFGTNVKPDRTAAGYTADGKVVLFVCDGRIAQSDGATLLELAQVMKGIGCVGAVNFDGGGSTGMMVGTNHINNAVTEDEAGVQSPYNRAVVSTMGFFKK